MKFQTLENEKHKIVLIEGNRIEEVWFRSIIACTELGTEYIIDKGEYQGQKRKELDLAILQIKTPWVRPLACQSPHITPTTDSKIEEYFKNYLLDPDFKDKEEEKNNEYKYATWIAPSWENCCKLLVDGEGGCNQATISLGSIVYRDVYSITQQVEKGIIETYNIYGKEKLKEFTHPPCLRLIDMRIRYNTLIFYLYFRSWDLVAGLPQNMGGLQLLKEQCLEYINSYRQAEGKPLLKDGIIVAISKGLHIYDHFWKMSKDLIGNNTDVLKDVPGIFVV